jgi:hypothetical protein
MGRPPSTNLLEAKHLGSKVIFATEVVNGEPTRRDRSLRGADPCWGLHSIRNRRSWSGTNGHYSSAPRCVLLSRVPSPVPVLCNLMPSTREARQGMTNHHAGPGRTSLRCAELESREVGRGQARVSSLPLEGPE